MTSPQAGLDAGGGILTAGRSRRWRRWDGFLSAVPFYPLLLAAWVVLRPYSDNLAEVEPGEVLGPLLIVTGGVGVAYGILGLLLRDWRRAALVTVVLFLPFAMFSYIREAVPSDAVGDPRMLAALCLLTACVTIIVIDRLRHRLAGVTMALNLVSAVLVVLASITIVSYLGTEGDPFSTSASGPDGPNATLLSLDGPTADHPRDIYHLVFDRYGSVQALELEHGIDNRPFMAWLEEHGFHVIDGSRANYQKTYQSLAATFSMSLLSELGERMGPGSRSFGPLVERIQNSAVGAFLQSQGYRYDHLGSWYKATRTSAIADRSYAFGDPVDFASTLVDISVVPTITSAFATGNDRYADSADFEFDMLERLASEERDGPRYVFAHILVPHPPFVFLEDGSRKPDEATFATQVAYVNARIRRFVEPLLALPEDEQPIILLQADEGPYPYRYAIDEAQFDWADATDEELLTKFGVLDAMYLPGPEGLDAPPEDMSLVNTYREVLSRYFGADLPYEPDLSFTMRHELPYSFEPVTDRLDEAEARVGT